jgi:hypothetical protein
MVVNFSFMEFDGGMYGAASIDEDTFVFFFGSSATFMQTQEYGFLLGLSE